jgi:two-component system sensor histidine kinase GlrK
MRLSIFWRLALGCLAIVLVMAGANLFALLQLRQLTALSNQLVSYHYPAVDTAKRLIAHLYTQLRSEKKYLAVRDVEYMRDFEEEGKEVRRTLAALKTQEQAGESQGLLQEALRLHGEYQALVRAEVAGRNRPSGSSYESRRDSLVKRITDTMQTYVGLHETLVSTGVSDSRARTIRAEGITQQLIVATLLFGLGLAGVASYSILRPLRRLQEHIRRIGHGQFGASVEVAAPTDVRELVTTVNWMGGKLQELDERKEEFLAHLSHELRTPMASIREGTQLLLDEIPGPVSPAQQETLRIMMGSSERLIRLISTLLDLSKMEAGMMKYQIIPTDLKRLAEASVNKVRLLAEAKRIQIITDAPPGRLWARVDGTRIEQVLDNLLSNALKFSPEGAVVNLRMESNHAADVVRVMVSDTGPGIPAEELPHIFERFYQGRAQGRTAARTPMAGSGLGLALAKRVVEAHRGRISVESERGKGTTVRFELPLSPSAGAA